MKIRLTKTWRALLRNSVIMLLIVISPTFVIAAQKKPAAKRKPPPKAPVNELARLREEFIKATNEYKANLEKLRASYQKTVVKAEAELAKSQDLFAQGLISKNDLAANERAVVEANAKVAEVSQRLSSADTQIANILVEADAEKQLAKIKPVPKGGMVNTASFIRYNGASVWLISDAWKVQRFFQDAFKKQLPISVFGQGSIHDRWRLDHRNAMDISLHPDGPEGQALLGYLRANGIPFLAFRGAIPGTATGPHIHIGRPSHRY